MTVKEYIKRWQENARGGNGCYPTNSFSNHAAKLTRYSDNFYIIDWRNKDGQNAYYVRYVFDGDKLYITGDLSEGIFQRYGDEPARRWLGGMNDLHYLMEKLRCSAFEKYDVDDDVWQHDFNNWVRDDEPSEDVRGIVEDIWGEFDGDQFEKAVWRNAELQDELDFDSIEFISGFGAVPNSRIILWFEGLKMAYEQLGDELPK